jgi:hypothetical protein
MISNTGWILLLAACGAAAATAFTAWTRRKRHTEKQAHKAVLHEWENEGGNLAPPQETAAPVVTAGSA